MFWDEHGFADDLAIGLHVASLLPPLAGACPNRGDARIDRRKPAAPTAIQAKPFPTRKVD
jgi:hypothetical protein